jgi:hypothetical protein
MSTLTKGLIMTVVTLIGTTIANSGFPTTATGWELLGITAVGTILTYLGKNAVFPSNSIFGTINLRDLLSGAIVAIGAGLSSWVATVATNTPVDWHQLLTFVVSVVIGYFGKNFLSGSTTPTT